MSAKLLAFETTRNQVRYCANRTDLTAAERDALRDAIDILNSLLPTPSASSAQREEGKHG